MIEEKIQVLEATAVRFYSQLDESMFFKWIGEIACFKRAEGRGLTIFISIDVNLVDETAMRELLAVFHRYEIDMKQLIEIAHPEFSGWFTDPTAYWFVSVFK